MSRKPIRLGLTGGIGSGKSTVASIMASAGAAVMDADAISRSLTLPGGRAIPAILAEFGEQLIAPDGAMDRAAMRALVFSDLQSKRRLEAIIHPLVGQVLPCVSRSARMRVYPPLPQSGALLSHLREQKRQIRTAFIQPRAVFRTG